MSEDDVFMLDRVKSEDSIMPSTCFYETNYVVLDQMRAGSSNANDDQASNPQTSKSIVNRPTRSFLVGKRFHLAEQETSKISEIKPGGKISSDLRRAMGLSREQLPLFIYKMRNLGYPPGWLRHAKQPNQLDFIDKDSTLAADDCIDLSSLIRYPGFNDSFDRNQRDEYRFLECKPYDKRDNIDSFYADLCKRQKRPVDLSKLERERDKIMRELKSIQGSDLEVEILDMEISASPRRKDDVSNVLVITDDEDDNEIASASATKHQPGCEIVGEAELSVPAGPSDEMLKILIADASVDEATPSTSNLVSEEAKLAKTESFTKLPDLSSFSKNVMPFKHFENLSNSTGAFKKVFAALNKAKDRLKRIDKKK